MTQHRSERVRGRRGLLIAGLVISSAALADVDPKHIADVDIAVTNRHSQCVELALTSAAPVGAKIFRVNVSLKDYQRALTLAIERSGVFSGICASGQAGVELSIVVANASYTPKDGMKIEGQLPTQWRLADPATRRVLYQQQMAHTAFNDRGIGGAPRIYASVDMAIRAGIVQGLEDISKLDLTAER